jgi:hypothetical protein
VTAIIFTLLPHQRLNCRARVVQRRQTIALQQVERGPHLLARQHGHLLWRVLVEPVAVAQLPVLTPATSVHAALIIHNEAVSPAARDGDGVDVVEAHHPRRRRPAQHTGTIIDAQQQRRGCASSLLVRSAWRNKQRRGP